MPQRTLEYGRIQSLLDKFGFIYCADRPIDIFFHYSESMQPIDSLYVGQEVSFYVGPAQEIGGRDRDRDRDRDHRDGYGYGNGYGYGYGYGYGNDVVEKKEKLSAYSVSVVEQGTVIWETEDEPNKVCRGRVERLIRWPSTSTSSSSIAIGGKNNDRNDRGVNINAEGTIRIILEDDSTSSSEDQDQGRDQDQDQVEEGGGDQQQQIQQQQQQQQEKGEEQHNREGSDDQKDDTTSTTNKNDNVDGTKSKGAKQKEQKQKRGPIVRYKIDDYQGFHNDGIGLARNDLVEFYVFTEKRSGLKYARNIVMVQTEQERLEEERERALIESGSYERGVVTSLKAGYGFLRSNRRRDEVYFHYSHIQLPEGEEGEEHVLQEGQDMEFYVVTEEDGSGRSKTSARLARFLERGSVQFQQILATGVTGKVVDCPIPAVEMLLSSPHGKKKYRQNNSNNRSTKDSGKDGKVQLDKAIQFQPVESQQGSSSSTATMEINEVVLHPNDCPTLERDGNRISTWVREGDTLLFDVVRDVVDGTCRVLTTKSLQAAEGDAATEADVKCDEEEKSTTEEKEKGNETADTAASTASTEEKENITTEEEKETSEDQKEEGMTEGKEKEEVNANTNTNPIIPRVRIIALSTENRAEGTIASIKDNFGFIRPADHSADIYFRLDEVFPPDLSDDLWRNRIVTSDSGSNNDKTNTNAKRILKVGARVMFDLTSQQLTKNSGRARGKDSARAERILVVESKKKVKKSGDSTCQGYVLMEPSHTSLSNTPSHIAYGNTSNAGSKEGGRWDNCVKEKNGKLSDFINNKKEEGSILLLSDPCNVFENDRVSYVHNATRSNPDKDPKRGDLICFLKGKGNKARDVRILKRNAAQTVKGNMNAINISEGTASFTSEDGKIYPISLSEVISCDLKVLKDNVGVEGILQNDSLVGICRTADLYLNSSIGSGLKERPRLNLTVKNELKGLGGKIIAQSGMAKGPDGTTGFHAGWTTRISKFYPPEPENIAEVEEKDGNGDDSNQSGDSNSNSNSNEGDKSGTNSTNNIVKDIKVEPAGDIDNIVKDIEVESGDPIVPKTEST